MFDFELKKSKDNLVRKLKMKNKDSNFNCIKIFVWLSLFGKFNF